MADVLDDVWTTRLSAWRWWTLALRGVAAMLFGILAAVLPAAAVYALVAVFGVYVIIDGILTLSLAAHVASVPRSGSVIGRGIAAIGAGTVALVWPGINAFSFLVVVALWALVSGALEIATAIQLRRVLRREWLLPAQGFLSIVFGVASLVAPLAGTLVLGIWIGGYAIAVGALLVVGALVLRRHQLQPDPAHT